MKPKLIFITGAPGVGKTTVSRILFRRLLNSAWLDGDDVWRMNPFRANDTTIPMVESNIQFVLRNYVSSGFSYVILSWVLHRQPIIDSMLKGLKGLEYDLFVFTLVCDEASLAARLKSDPLRETITELALKRLRQSKELETKKIDTTSREPEDIAHEILEFVNKTEALRKPNGRKSCFW